jgi:hypothetical protein
MSCARLRTLACHVDFGIRISRSSAHVSFGWPVPKFNGLKTIEKMWYRAVLVYKSSPLPRLLVFYTRLAAVINQNIYANNVCSGSKVISNTPYVLARFRFSRPRSKWEEVFNMTASRVLSE